MHGVLSSKATYKHLVLPCEGIFSLPRGWHFSKAMPDAEAPGAVVIREQWHRTCDGMLGPRQRAVSGDGLLEWRPQRPVLALASRGVPVRLRKLPHGHVAVQAGAPRPVMLQ